jgi:hypothetical protein
MKAGLRVLAGAVVLVCAAGCAQTEKPSGTSSQAGAGTQAAGNPAAAGGQSSGEASPVAQAHAQFEQNATDGDYEAVFEAMGGSEGLKALTVTGPDGRTLVDFKAPDAGVLGIRQFRFESPEPKDLASLKAAYPEGEYKFAGTSASGTRLAGSASLHHGLPATTSFVRPAAGAENVTMNHLVLSWKPVADVAAFIVYIEQDELGVNINAKLPGSASSFVVPDGFLAPETEYTMGVATVMKSGNASYIEGTFTTAAKE